VGRDTISNKSVGIGIILIAGVSSAELLVIDEKGHMPIHKEKAQLDNRLTSEKGANTCQWSAAGS